MHPAVGLALVLHKLEPQPRSENQLKEIHCKNKVKGAHSAMVTMMQQNQSGAPSDRFQDSPSRPAIFPYRSQHRERPAVWATRGTAEREMPPAGRGHSSRDPSSLDCGAFTHRASQRSQAGQLSPVGVALSCCP